MKRRNDCENKQMRRSLCQSPLRMTLFLFQRQRWGFWKETGLHNWMWVKISTSLQDLWALLGKQLGFPRLITQTKKMPQPQTNISLHMISRKTKGYFLTPGNQSIYLPRLQEQSRETTNLSPHSSSLMGCLRSLVATSWKDLGFLSLSPHTNFHSTPARKVGN